MLLPPNVLALTIQQEEFKDEEDDDDYEDGADDNKGAAAGKRGIDEVVEGDSAPDAKKAKA